MTAAVRIHIELRGLAHLEVGELRFLEVGGHPYAGVRHHREHWLAGLHQLPHLHLLPRDDAGDRSRYACVGELQLRVITRSLRAREPRLGESYTCLRIHDARARRTG